MRASLLSPLSDNKFKDHKAKLRILVYLGLALFLPSAAFAWSGAGHLVIAAEAWRELPPKLQTRASEILKHHPDFQKWERASADAGDIDPAAFIFMHASTWADEVRERDSSYSHPRWHFVDYPLKPRSFRFAPSPSPEDDILFGIEQSEKTLTDRRATPEARAVALAYLIHLIGDIHQPLHCASLVDDTYPKGDKGGNDFYIRPAERGISLHYFWDGLLGRSTRIRSQWNEAVRLQAEHPRKSLPELNKSRTPKDWSMESRDLAIEKAYLRAKLKGSTSADNAPSLPSDYATDAKVVAEKQAALAGYRLADAIEKWVR